LGACIALPGTSIDAGVPWRRGPALSATAIANAAASEAAKSAATPAHRPRRGVAFGALALLKRWAEVGTTLAGRD
jgi:hypothetical protein